MCLCVVSLVYVLSMCCLSLVYFLSMSCLCLVYALSFSCICVYVLSMSCICPIYVLSMSCICPIYVLSMSCICPIFVLSMANRNPRTKNEDYYFQNCGWKIFFGWRWVACQSLPVKKRKSYYCSHYKKILSVKALFCLFLIVSLNLKYIFVLKYTIHWDFAREILWYTIHNWSIISTSIVYMLYVHTLYIHIY